MPTGLKWELRVKNLTNRNVEALVDLDRVTLDQKVRMARRDNKGTRTGTRGAKTRSIEKQDVDEQIVEIDGLSSCEF